MANQISVSDGRGVHRGPALRLQDEVRGEEFGAQSDTTRGRPERQPHQNGGAGEVTERVQTGRRTTRGQDEEFGRGYEG